MKERIRKIFGGEWGALRAVLLVFAVALAVFSVIWKTGAGKYRDRFIDGTVINGFDVSALTAEEAESLIREEAEDYRLLVRFPDGEEDCIEGSEIGYHFVSDGAVGEMLRNQNPYTWVAGKLGLQTVHAAEVATDYDREMLRDAVLALPAFAEENITHPRDAYMIWDGEAYTIVPEERGNEPDPERVLSVLENALADTRPSADLTDDIYVLPVVTKDDKGLIGKCRSGNSLIRCDITYDLPLGARVHIDGRTVQPWLIDDLAGGFVLPNEVIRAHCRAIVKEMAEEHDTYKKDVLFNTTEKGEITINLAKHGFRIDVDAETAQLAEDIRNHMKTEREPVWEFEGFTRENDYVGKTYIEVDIEAQHVWYYIDGELYLDTPVVTGTKTNPERRTPTGVFTLSFKATDRYLQGPINPETNEPTYRSHVDYWMPFNGGVGFHDAQWRGSFGGTIYYYSGSHGCVNMPYSAAKKMYEVIDKTVPIIVY